jgi:predicted nucleic acid-binding protein
MTLVDTSVWIEVFRRHRPLRLESVVAFDEIVTCLPVIQEILQGFRDEAAFRTVRESMLALPIVESPLTIDTVEQAAQMYRTARRAGRTIRSSVDCLVAACAIRHNLEVVHRDRDFGALACVTPLRQRQV